MLVDFFKNTSENNRVDKTQFLTATKSYVCTLKDECNVLTPTLIFTGVLSDILNSNYCYIGGFNRYYYITDYTSVRNNIFEISLSVDVLMSFKDIIKQQKALVARNEFEFDLNIIDDMIQIKPQKNVKFIDKNYHEGVGDEYVYYGYSFIGNDNKPHSFNEEYHIMMSLVGNNYPLDTNYDSLIYGICDSSTIVLVDGYYNNILDVVLAPSFFQSLGAFFQNTAEYINDCYILPFAVQYCSGVSLSIVDNLKIGKLPLNGNFSIVNTNTTKCRLLFLDYWEELNFISGEITPHKEAIHLTSPIDGFLELAPYTTVECFLPYVGFVELDPYFVFNYFFVIVYDIDIKTGNFTVMFTKPSVKIDTTPIPSDSIYYTFSGNISIKLPLGSSNSNDIYRNLTTTAISLSVKTATAISNRNSEISRGKSMTTPKRKQISKKGVATIENAKKEFASDMTDIGVSSAVNVVNSITPHYNGGVINSDSSSLFVGKNICFKITYPKIIDIENYNHLYGRPLMKSTILQNLSGFTVIGDVHLEGFGLTTVNELEEIESLLKSGVIL